MFTSASQASMPLFLANGVTGVRVMWGNPSFGFPMGNFHFRWRSQIEEGKLLGPRMVVASNIFDGPKPIWPSSLGIKTPEAARKAVRKAKADGADFVKVYSMLSPEVFRAIAAECKAQEHPVRRPRPVVRVRPRGVGPRAENVRAPVRRPRRLLDPGATSFWRSEQRSSPRARTSPRSSRSSLRSTGNPARRSTRPLAAGLFAKLKANGTWQCPTLTVLRAIASLDDDAFRNDPRLKYVDAMTRFVGPEERLPAQVHDEGGLRPAEVAFARAVDWSGGCIGPACRSWPGRMS